ncbi:MAG: DNA polymerase III subunit chi [Pseudomonadota bacterium]
MTRVDFYFNAPAKAEVARKLAAKTFQAGQRALVFSRQPARCQELDQYFWTAQQLSFLPHVRCGHPLAGETPILIGENPDELASPDVLINLEGETPAFFGRFARVLEIVTTAPEDRDQARARLRFYRERGYQVETHDLADGR